MSDSISDLSTVGFYTVADNLTDYNHDGKTLLGDAETSQKVFSLIDDCDRQALIAIQTPAFPENITVPAKLESLGHSVNRFVEKVYEKLDKKFGRDLPLFCGFANKYFNGSVISNQLFFMNGIDRGLIKNNRHTKKLCEPDGYLEVIGRADVAFQLVSKLTFIKFMQKSYVKSEPADFLSVLALYWLALVDEKNKITKVIDLDLLGDAFETLCFASDENAIPVGREFQKDEYTVARKKGGEIRWMNDDKAQQKKFVKELWDSWQSNPGQYKNKTKFAQAMLEKIPKPDNPKDDHKVLNSVAVITGWCRDWEREKSQSAS